jgi:hypothetical protein
VESGEDQPVFRRHIWPPSSWSKSGLSKNPAEAAGVKIRSVRTTRRHKPEHRALIPPFHAIQCSYCQRCTLTPNK